MQRFTGWSDDCLSRVRIAVFYRHKRSFGERLAACVGRNRHGFRAVSNQVRGIRQGDCECGFCCRFVCGSCGSGCSGRKFTFRPLCAWVNWVLALAKNFAFRMEQQTNLRVVPSVLSLAAGFAVSSSPSEDCACNDEEAEDDYDEGPKDIPEVADVSSCIQKQT